VNPNPAGQVSREARIPLRPLCPAHPNGAHPLIVCGEPV